MAKNRKLPKNLVRIFDLPKEISSDDPKLCVYENNGLLLENHTEVLTYTTELMRIATKQFILRVDGEGLQLLQMDKEGVFISGSIRQITYEKER